MLGLTLAVLLLASVNFQLNLGYALTFLLAGSALASLWMAHRNLRGLQIRLDPLQPVFQGERALLPLVLQHRVARRDCHGLSIALGRSKAALAWTHADVPAGQSQRIILSSVPHQRGWQQLPRVVLESRFPLGVFHLWSYWQPQARVLVYPAPETSAPPIQYADSHEDGTAQPIERSAADQDGIRSYQRGDALRSVVWKKAATALASGSGDLVVRDGHASRTQSLWLEVRATGLSDPEAQIARLTAWVLQADAQHWRWGLSLPSGRRIDPGTGPHHLALCLEALATDGRPLPEKTD